MVKMPKDRGCLTVDSDKTIDKGKRGILYLCATPIGNLEDITIRALKVLRKADFIAAEDTRHTLKLLNRYRIKVPLISYHEHNKNYRKHEIIDKLTTGNNVVMVSDAGMPGISDPGEDLVKEAIEAGIEVRPIPGPTALIAAVVISGLPTGRFIFEGFLPRNKKDRESRLKDLKTETRTMVFYESPHRLKQTLNQMYEIFGDRKLAIAREMTKAYEEVFRGNISDALKHFAEKTPRGEFTIVVAGSGNKEKMEQTSCWEQISIKDHIKMYTEQGIPKKESIKKVAKDRNLPKTKVYRESFDLE